MGAEILLKLPERGEVGGVFLPRGEEGGEMASLLNRVPEVLTGRRLKYVRGWDPFKCFNVGGGMSLLESGSGAGIESMRATWSSQVAKSV